MPSLNLCFKFVLFLCISIFISCQGYLVPPSVDYRNLAKTAQEKPLNNNNNLFYPEFEIKLPLELLHKFDVSSAPKQKLMRVEHILFVPTKNGRLEAYDLKTAKRIGKMKITGGVHANILPLDENLLISLEFGEKSLYAYSPYQKQKLWTAELGSIKAIPVIFDEWIFVASLYRGIFCINKSNGEILWKTDLKSQLHANPLVINEMLIQGTESGELVALSTDDGQIKWNVDFLSPILTSPILANKNIIVCTTDGTVVALTFDGEIVWQRKFGLEFRRTPSASDTKLITAGQDGIIRALDLKSGSLLWQYETRVVIGTSPLITSSHVIFGTLDKRLIFLSLETGEEEWQVELFGRVRTDPMIYDNGLIIGSENKFIYVFKSSENND